MSKPSDVAAGLTHHAMLVDYSEQPKPIIIKRRDSHAVSPPESDKKKQDGDDVTFFHDFVAGGVAGSASIVVGHPFDTVKVRMQTAATGGAASLFAEFGGVASLYRGMAAPLSSAAVINAIIFGSYGFSSRLYDEYIVNGSKPTLLQENGAVQQEEQTGYNSWQKDVLCGSFAGLVQCVIICPMEHVKCRLQVQHGQGSADYRFKGPMHATKVILKEHGFLRLFQGWWSTIWREVPSFGLYFACYGSIKDRMLSYFQQGTDEAPTHAQVLTSSAMAGGIAGSITWGAVYPFDVIKTRVQTASLDATRQELRMWRIGYDLCAKYGWRYLFRGLGVTLVRAFPVNGTIFPVYELTLVQVVKWENQLQS